MSDSNSILFSSAQSIEAYQQAIEQSTQVVMQWLKQLRCIRQNGRELRDRIKLDFNPVAGQRSGDRTLWSSS